ncbi:MAG: YkgJ family cysteine cluster protein [Fervidicoccaceae archaeon]|nr:YkgJ family cysteine cluster protein [Fervidicoccaceae archaeon]
MVFENIYCLRCNKCCRDTEMILLLSDIDRITDKGFRDFYELKNGFYVLRNINGKCVFLDPTGRCIIYEDRPLGCRVYPLILDEDNGAMLDKYCPLSDFFVTLKHDLRRGCELLVQFMDELSRDYGYSVDINKLKTTCEKLINK